MNFRAGLRACKWQLFRLPDRRLPMQMHSGVLTNLDLHTVAGAAPALAINGCTGFPFNRQIVKSCRNLKATEDYKDYD